MSADVSDAMIPTPVGSGWKLQDGSLVPILFEGPTTAEMLDDLLCGCRGRQQCSNDCSCFKNNMACTEQCMCSGGDRCQNSKTKNVDSNNDDLE